MKKLITILLILFFAAGCTATEKTYKKTTKEPVSVEEKVELKKTEVKEKTETKAKPLLIENVAVSKKTIDVDKSEKTVISFKLTSDADEVKLTVYDSVNQVILEEVYKDLKEGKNEFVWDGKTKDGKLCEADAYTFVIKAGRGKRTFTYNPAVNTGHKKLEVEKVFIDVNKEEVQFILPSAAWLRIRIGLDEGTLLNTFIPWTPMEAGRHALKWDGWDQDKTIRYYKDPKLGSSIEAYSLPANSIIVAGEKKRDREERQKYLFSGKTSTYPLKVLSIIYIREPEFTVSFKGDFEKTEEGLFIISGKVPVSVKLHPETRKVLINTQYELMYFIDTVFVYEDEQAYDPFTYIWDTKGLKEGEHVFTVNLLGYNMAVGIKSLKVYVKPAQ